MFKQRFKHVNEILITTKNDDNNDDDIGGGGSCKLISAIEFRGKQFPNSNLPKTIESDYVVRC